MRLLVLASRLPWPLDKGDKLRLFHQLGSLKKSYSIDLVCLHDQAISHDELDHLKQVCDRVFVIPHRSFDKLIGLLFGAFNGLPFSVAYFHSPFIKYKVSKVLSEIDWDITYVQLIRMGPYLKLLKEPVVLDYMDAFSLSFKLRARLSKNFFSRWFFNFESGRVHHYEKELLKSVQSASAISARDAQHLRFRNSANHCVVPNGVDTCHFSPDALPEIKPEFDLVFVGNLGYFPNVQAARLLALEILPRLRNKGFCPTLLIAGARPDASVSALKSEHVQVLGNPEDIRIAYKSARIFVAPLFSGAGQQNKMLEAMSLGMPAITTSHVNVSIGARHAYEVMVADGVTDFIQLIIELLEKPELQGEIGQHARNFIVNTYSWERSNQRLFNLLKNA